MFSQSENTKVIAKNTIMLYVRMLFSMLVSLYTSRVILNTLGVEDYGIYNVVGGLVAMFGFLNASMSGATSRFLTFELGRGDESRIKKTFASALIIHIGIAVIVFIVAETIGLWFLMNKLVIPESRMWAAHVVYQLSVLSAMVGITQVPYNADIIAHEKMDVYAYVEMFNVVLRLVIVFMLLIFNFDKLILYSVLIFLVSLVIAMIYRWYCISHYEESHFSFEWNKGILRKMLAFCSWDLYGNASSTLRQHGVNMILNMFIGPVVNAASGIATTVGGVTMSFIGNVVTAFRPSIIKRYSVEDYGEMFRLMNMAVRICVALVLMLVIPFVFEMDFILYAWLGMVPDYAVNFCRILLITNCFSVVTSILNIGIHATGRIFLISFISGTLIWMAVPVIYVLLRNGFHPDWAYICNGIVSMTVVVVNSLILKRLVRNFPIVGFWTDGVLRSLSAGMLVLLSVYAIHQNMDYGWGRLLVAMALSVIETGTVGFFFLIDSETRRSILDKMRFLSRTKA